MRVHREASKSNGWHKSGLGSCDEEKNLTSSAALPSFAIFTPCGPVWQMKVPA